MEARTSLADGFSNQLRRHAGKTAFVIGTVALTYRQLSSMADDFAHSLGLAEAGQSGNQQYTIGWCGKNHADLAALYIALIRADHILALMDPNWSPKLQATLCKRFGIDLVIFPDTALGELQVETNAATADQQPSVERPFLVGFTSGSTAEPKAFIRSQYSWRQTFLHSAREFALSDSIVVLAPGPLSHGLSFYAMAETLNFGGTFHSMQRFDPEACLKLICSSQVTTLVVVPTMLVAIVETVERDRFSMDIARSASRLTRIISAGAKLAESVRKSVSCVFQNAEVSEYYGASELSFVSVFHQRENRSKQSVGRAFSGVQISIRERNGVEVKPGETGIVHIKSDMVADGYLIADDRSNVRPLEGAGDWKTVGDLGYLDEQGTLFLTDRVDNMLISGGLNVYPAEIETLLHQCQLVQECVVVGIADVYWGDRIVAVIKKAKKTVEPTDQLLRDFCETSLSSKKIPREFYLCDAWPMTTSGKIDRRRLVDWIGKGSGELFQLVRESSGRD